MNLINSKILFLFLSFFIPSVFSSPSIEYDLMVSFSVYRDDAVRLEGQTVAGDLRVFMTPGTGIRQVRFFLDDPDMADAPIQTESLSPYDFFGTATDGSAIAFDTTSLTDGGHSITALVYLTDGSTKTVEAFFTVDNDQQEESVYTLVNCDLPSRDHPVPLEDQTVSGGIHVFVTPETAVHRVRFFLDDPNMTDAPILIDDDSPYDFNGTAGDGSAIAFDTTTLADGGHSITALVDLADGSTETIRAFFFVENDPYNGGTDSEKPNIILIMADDMGYECVGTNGALSYKTPALDRMADDGMRFTHCYSQPLCTPSRVKLMTGLYNYRNYEYFGYINESNLTFGTVMKAAGYSTCIVGKWQLNGLTYKLPGFNDHTRPYRFGFDEYCLWQLTVPDYLGSRYANPVIEQNGEMLDLGIDDYGPDVFADYIVDFISRKKDTPFFIYYPMVLPHYPFVPTPDSEEWAFPNRRLENDVKYFGDMIGYIDKIVDRIVQTLKAHELYDNTVVIFTADNGTNRLITTETTWGSVQGFKGNTTDAGTRVPLLISWPKYIEDAYVFDGLVDFSDFMPTFAQIAGMDVETDGKSLLPLLRGTDYEEKKHIFMHYDPRWSESVNIYRNQFARTKAYKLYQDDQFFCISSDRLEQHPLPDSLLTDEQLSIKSQLREVIDQAPAWVEQPRTPSMLQKIASTLF